MPKIKQKRRISVNEGALKGLSLGTSAGPEPQETDGRLGRISALLSRNRRLFLPLPQ